MSTKTVFVGVRIDAETADRLRAIAKTYYPGGQRDTLSAVARDALAAFVKRYEQSV